MAERDREGVCSIRRLRRSVQAEDARDHRLDLLLVRGPVACDGGLDLARRVRGGRKARLGGEKERDTARLRRAHHRVAVVLCEDALHGDGIGLVLPQDSADTCRDERESFTDRGIDRGADDPDVHEPRATRPVDVHDADAAAGQNGRCPDRIWSITVFMGESC